MTQGTAIDPASGQAAGSARRAPPPARGEWWRVSWSGPAALRALRAAIVVPGLFALTFKVIGDAQMTIFAVFGAFGALVMSSFGGSRRDKALSHLGLAIAGSVTLIIGTVVSGSAWLATIATVPVAFAVYFAGSAGPNAASGVTACLLAYVLPVASAGGVGTLPSRLAGWWLASAVSTAVVLLLYSRSPGDRLRCEAARLAADLAVLLDAAGSGTATADDRNRVAAAKHDLMSMFVATPYRPIGLAAADQALASVIHLLEWCAGLAGDAADGHFDLTAATRQDRALLSESVRLLRQIDAVLSGEATSIDLERVWHARLDSAEQLQRLAGDPGIAVSRADCAFHAQAIAVAASAAMAEAMIASGLATPAEMREERRRWVAGQSAGQAELTSRPSAWLASLQRIGDIVAVDASLRSVWFRNSLRGAIALAAAVAVAKLTDLQHAFWVVLGTLSVLRTSAASTGATATRALAGTIVGFAVGGALLVGIGTSPAALWIVFPIAVLVAAYTPGTAPFWTGQAAFTITVVVLFNILVPAGWKVGLLRVEDVAIGTAVSLIVGFLFWPRGVSGVVGDNLADAFRRGAEYLTDAAGWVLGDRAVRPDRADRAATAMSAGTRLDDAVRSYLTELGSKRLAKSDLWALVMASTRLRLTAHSMESLPGSPGPHEDHGRLHEALGRQLAGLSGFYGQLAADVGRPAGVVPQPLASGLPPSGISATIRSPCGREAAYWSDGLWVGHHLDHLEAHAADLAGPAERLARLRRRPWWR
jgi:uncharacterized membrane protein YccC